MGAKTKTKTKNLPFAEQYKQVMQSYVACAKEGSEIAIGEFRTLLQSGEASDEEKAATVAAIRVQEKLIAELGNKKYLEQKNEGILRRLLGVIGKLVKSAYDFLANLVKSIGRGVLAVGRWVWNGAKNVVLNLARAAKSAFWTVVSITARGVDFVLEVTSTLIAQGIHLCGGTLADLNEMVGEPIRFGRDQTEPAEQAPAQSAAA